jgi:hypothetical protein
MGGFPVRRYLVTALLLALLVPALRAADPTDTPAAAATRKKLQTKVSLDDKESLLKDVLDELKEAADVHFQEDTKGGVNLNSKITYKAKDKPLQEVLNGICDKFEFGYYVISRKGDAYDGLIRITKSKERGTKGVEGTGKTAAAPAEKPDKTGKPKKPDKTVKTEPEPKEKPDATEKPEKTSTPEEDAEEMEKIAGRRLKLAKEVLGDGKAEKAQSILQDLVKKYPKTKAAEEAKKLLTKDNDNDK